MSGDGFLYAVWQMVRVSYGVENQKSFGGRVLERERRWGAAFYRIEHPDPVLQATWFEEACLDPVAHVAAPEHSVHWLAPLCAQIRASGKPPVQTEALVARVIEVAEICEQRVPEAPAMQFDVLTDEDEEPSLEVAWFNRRLQRTFALVAEADGSVVLHLLDMSVTPGRGTHEREFTSEQLKTAVLAFFDGWVPHG